MSEPTDDDKKPEFNDPTAPVWADPAAPQVPAPPAQPYGQPAGQYSQPQYSQPQHSQPQYSQPYPAYGQSPYATGAPVANNTSAIVLTVLSALSLCNILAVGSLVLGIIALTKNSTDPAQSRRLTKIGWIVFAAVWVVGVLGIIVYGIFIATAFRTNGPSTFNSGY